MPVNQIFWKIVPMKAILQVNGKSVKVISYNISTVTLATKSGQPAIVDWAEIDYLESEDGLQRHKDVVNGTPMIIVQAPPPPSIRHEPDDLLPPNRPQNDFEDAIALIDLIDNDDAREAVKAALTASFEPEEKKKLWAMLTAEQKAKLKG